MLTREAWEESSGSARGVSLRCRRPLAGTFVADEGKAVFDNRLCVERGKNKWQTNQDIFCCYFRIKFLFSCNSRRTQLPSLAELNH